MGNKVSAAGPADVPAPPMPGMPPMPSSAAPSSQAGSQPEPSLPPAPVPDNGPGSFEDLHKKTKEVFPIPYEGAKLIINKGLSNHFQVSHNITMSTMQPSGYKFGCTYVGTQQFGPMEAYPIIIGEVDPSGNLNAQMIHQFASNIRSKFISQIQGGKWMATQIATDIKGDDFQAGITIANPDLFEGSGVIVGQYLQNITQRLALGTELVYQRGGQVPGGQFAAYTFAGRYTGDNWQASWNVTPDTLGLHSCYYHKISENLQMGVELEGSLRTQDCTGTIGYTQELPSANMTFKGQVDSNWCVGATLEKKLQPLPFTFVLSALANHTKGAYRFGVGLILG